MGEKLLQQAEPSSPAANYADIYPDSADKLRIKSKDSNGIVSRFFGGEPYNIVRNGGFWFAQRQAPGTLTTYSNIGGRIITADGWGISNENASTQYRRVDTRTSFETGMSSPFYGEFTKITSNGKIQITQVIEMVDCSALRGRNVRLQLKMKSVVAGSAQWNIALVAWSTTGDIVPSGAGLVFTAQGAAGVDPTLAAGFAYLAPVAGKAGDNCTAGSNSYAATVTTSWQRFGGVFTVPTNTRNLMVVIYSHNQVTTTNGVALAEVSLTDGEEITDWAPKAYSEEMLRVQRYYAKTFSIDQAPIQSLGLQSGEAKGIAGKAGAVANAGFIFWKLPTTLRAGGITPVTYNPAAANVNVRDITASVDHSALVVVQSTADLYVFGSTGNASTAVGDQLGLNASVDCEL